jgi:hypothetical protein
MDVFPHEVPNQDFLRPQSHLRNSMSGMKLTLVIYIMVMTHDGNLAILTNYGDSRLVIFITTGCFLASKHSFGELQFCQLPFPPSPHRQHFELLSKH